MSFQLLHLVLVPFHPPQLYRHQVRSPFLLVYCVNPDRAESVLLGLEKVGEGPMGAGKDSLSCSGKDLSYETRQTAQA